MEALVLVVYIAALGVLFLYGLHTLGMVYRYSRMPPPPILPDPALSSDILPIVTVQLPIYNEYYVVERLIESVCALDYPQHLLDIQVLDDSTDETFTLCRNLCQRKFDQGFRISHRHRYPRVGFKAGALRDGLTRARGEFIAVFDADFLPNPDFLRATIPYLLADGQLGMVQGRWDHINIDYSLLTRLQAIALDAHFVMEQQVRNRWGLFMNFNGTAGIWRRSCIEDAGNWQADTLTEDLDLSYRAQLLGWRFLYLNDLAVPAELPSEINGLKSQQFRWTKGAIETARKLLVHVCRAPLHWRVKLNAVLHLTSNLVFPCILVVAILNIPIILVKQSRPEYGLVFDFMSVFTLGSIASLIFYMTAQRAVRPDWSRRIALIPLSLAGTMGMAVNNTRAVVQALARWESPFVRTPKYAITKAGETWRGRRYALRAVRFDVVLEALLAIYFAIAIAFSIHYVEVSLIPFQLMFLFGFGFTAALSIKHAWKKRGEEPHRHDAVR